MLSYGAFSMSVNGEPTRVSHEYVEKNMVRYTRSHGRFAHCSCETPATFFNIFCSTVFVTFELIKIQE